MSRLVANGQLEAEEMLCGFHQNGIVLIISPLDDQIEEAERLNLHAILVSKRSSLTEFHQQEKVIYILCLLPIA